LHKVTFACVEQYLNCNICFYENLNYIEMLNNIPFLSVKDRNVEKRFNFNWFKWRSLNVKIVFYVSFFDWTIFGNLIGVLYCSISFLDVSWVFQLLSTTLSRLRNGWEWRRWYPECSHSILVPGKQKFYFTDGLHERRHFLLSSIK
jgi:hypothetical protein